MTSRGADTTQQPRWSWHGYKLLFKCDCLMVGAAEGLAWAIKAPGTEPAAGGRVRGGRGHTISWAVTLGASWGSRWRSEESPLMFPAGGWKVTMLKQPRAFCSSQRNDFIRALPVGFFLSLTTKGKEIPNFSPSSLPGGRRGIPAPLL